MSTAHQNENAERITRSIDSDLMMLAALTLIVAALDEHVVALIRISSRIRPLSLHFSSPSSRDSSAG